MYIPLFITSIYYYLAVKKAVNIDPSDYEYAVVWANITISEMIYLMVEIIGLVNRINTLSIMNIIFFIIIKDLLHYMMGEILDFIILTSAKHFATMGSWYAWFYSIPEHLIINIIPFVISYVFFPNPQWVLLLMIAMDIYWAIDNHAKNKRKYARLI